LCAAGDAGRYALPNSKRRRETKMKRLIALLATTVFVLSSAALAQDSKAADRNANDALSRLRSIKVTISAGGGRNFGLVKDKFELGEPVVIVIFMTNSGNEFTTVWISDPYYQNRPKLTRDGQEIEYKKEVKDVLKWKDNQGCGPGRSAPVDLDLNVEKEVDYLLLSDPRVTNNIIWYDPLEPGRYELSIRRRFGCAPNPEAESNTINFEVVAK